MVATKAKNYHIYRATQEEIRELKEQYNILGAYTKIVDDGLHLIVYAVAPKKEKKKKEERTRR